MAVVMCKHCDQQSDRLAQNEHGLHTTVSRCTETAFFHSPVMHPPSAVTGADWPLGPGSRLQHTHRDQSCCPVGSLSLTGSQSHCRDHGSPAVLTGPTDPQHTNAAEAAQPRVLALLEGRQGDVSGARAQCIRFQPSRLWGKARLASSPPASSLLSV